MLIFTNLVKEHGAQTAFLDAVAHSENFGNQVIISHFATR